MINFSANNYTSTKFKGTVTYNEENANKSRMGDPIRGFVLDEVNQLKEKAKEDSWDYNMDINVTGDGTLKVTCRIPNENSEEIMQGDQRFHHIPVMFLNDVHKYTLNKFRKQNGMPLLRW